MRHIEVRKLKRGQRFSFIPAAWHGPGIVLESFGDHSMWKIKFANDKVINPPGVWYGDPTEKVRLLAERTR